MTVCLACDILHGEVCPPSDLLHQALRYVNAGEWTTARSGDHQYTVRQRSWSQGLGPGHEALFRLIRDFHYVRMFRGRPYRSVDLQDDHGAWWSVWIMEDGTVINRKPLDAAGWDDESPQAALF